MNALRVLAPAAIAASPSILSDEIDKFVDELEQYFQEMSSNIGLARNHEPRRLLEAKEYRAAVIAAMTLLEMELGRRVEKVPIIGRLLSLRQLADQVSREALLPFSHDQVRGWIQLRNQVVHSDRSVPKGKATEIVEGVEQVLQLNSRLGGRNSD